MSRRAFKRTLLVFLIATVGGFLCAFLVTLSSIYFHIAAGHTNVAQDGLRLYLAYAIFCGIVPGAFLGIVSVPPIYLAFFSHLSDKELVRISCMIGGGTVVAGVLGSVAYELFALIAALLGFLTSVLAAVLYLKDRERLTPR